MYIFIIFFFSVSVSVDVSFFLFFVFCFCFANTFGHSNLLVYVHACVCVYFEMKFSMLLWKSNVGEYERNVEKRALSLGHLNKKRKKERSLSSG